MCGSAPRSRGAYATGTAASYRSCTPSTAVRSSPVSYFDYWRMRRRCPGRMSRATALRDGSAVVGGGSGT
eukprot:6046464-Prymnesium_polylepis.3